MLGTRRAGMASKARHLHGSSASSRPRSPVRVPVPDTWKHCSVFHLCPCRDLIRSAHSAMVSLSDDSSDQCSGSWTEGGSVLGTFPCGAIGLIRPMSCLGFAVRLPRAVARLRPDGNGTAGAWPDAFHMRVRIFRLAIPGIWRPLPARERTVTSRSFQSVCPTGKKSPDIAFSIGNRDPPGCLGGRARHRRQGPGRAASALRSLPVVFCIFRHNCRGCIRISASQLGPSACRCRAGMCSPISRTYRSGVSCLCTGLGVPAAVQGCRPWTWCRVRCPRCEPRQVSSADCVHVPVCFVKNHIKQPETGILARVLELKIFQFVEWS